MRICIVMEYHPDDLTGGSEIQVFGLARQFALAGHEVSYVCQRFDRSRPVDEIVDGVRVLRMLPWHRVFKARVGPRMLRTLRRLRPDIVYQRFASPYTGLAAYCARRLGVPFVWGCAEDCILEKDFTLREAGSLSGSPVRRTKQMVLRGDSALRQSLYSWGLRHATAVVVQNLLQLDLLRRNYHREGHLIPNGIVLPPISTEHSPQPLVLWLNRISPRKNVEAFVRMATALAPRHPEAQFVVVGGRQHDGYFDEVNRLISEAGNVRAMGGVPRGEVQAWFDQAWVFVITSCSEGFPNVLLQAWASGVPAVSLTVDLDGALAKGGLGLLSNTEEQLAEDVSRLLDDAGLRERLGAASRAHVAEHFEFGKVAAQYLDLFCDLKGDNADEH